MFCANCGKEIGRDAEFCPYCGCQAFPESSEKPKAFCRNCGKEIDEKAYVCPHCGVLTGITTQPAQPVPEKKKLDGLGLAGMILGIASFFTAQYFCIVPLAGLILSILAFRYKKTPTPSGFAIAGLVTNIITLLFWGVMWLIAFSISTDMFGWPFNWIFG